jgi:hypothetical protein
LPESITGTADGRMDPAGTWSSPATSSRITCALVPLIPKDDTPARRGRVEAGHGSASVSNFIPPVSQSTCGDGASTCNVRGSTPCRIAITILITPATPAAADVCPMFDLIDPSRNGPFTRSRPYVADNAWASIGSPRRVPVP